MSLNRDQARVVAVTLRMLEERLTEIERLMTGTEDGILYSRRAHLGRSQQERMRALIGGMRAEIRSLAETFHLRSEEQDAARKIVGLLSVTWESLEELHSRRLKSYGEVDPQLKETLDPAVTRLTRLVLALEAVANQREPAPSGQDHES